MFSTTVLNIHFMENVNRVVSTQLGKSLSSGDKSASVSADSIYLSRAKGGKEKSFRLSATCVSHYGREAFFGRWGVCGETKFRAHAWTFLSARWWSHHHRRTPVNYYRFRMTTSAHTWSDNAQSKRDMRSRFRFISADSRMCGFKMSKSHKRIQTI